MQTEFNLDQYLSEGVETIIKDALAASLKNPKETAFLLSYALSAKKAENARARFAKEGRHIPSFLIASITNRCNLHCAGCYARANHICHDGEQDALLTDDEWNRIFSQAEQIGVSFILLAGGEPMLRRGVVERAAGHRDLLFPVFTNGTLLSDGMLRLLDEHRNLVPIVSIEGNPEQTDARRGAGTYEALTRHMEQMRDQGILFGASVTLTTENFSVVTGDTFLKDLRSLGAKVVFFVDYVPADAGTEALAPGEREREALAARLDHLRAKQDGTIYVSFPGDEQYSGGCLAAGRGFFHINPTGGAEPCPFSPVSDTSLRQVSLLEALDSPLFQRLRASDFMKEQHTGACALFGKDDELAALCGTQA
ncbi:MAG: radical SAM protein [Eubacteriales bacterium]|nr:radical SAM protein [Eubacteriales bacterium]